MPNLSIHIWNCPLVNVKYSTRPSYPSLHGPVIKVRKFAPSPPFCPILCIYGAASTHLMGKTIQIGNQAGEKIESELFMSGIRLVLQHLNYWILWKFICAASPLNSPKTWAPFETWYSGMLASSSSSKH